MMRAIRHTRSLLLLLALAACGEVLPPFSTVPPPLEKGQTETATRVGVCFNALTASAEQIRAIAAEDCGPDTKPQRLDWDLTLNNCPILMPARATFACTAP